MLSSVIVSMSSGIPRTQLHGYAQVGGDLIIGESGRTKYGAVPPGHDGAYVSVVENDDRSVTIGSDDSGYGRIYLYQRGHRWAVATSLMDLADFVSEQRWPLDVDSIQVKGFLLGIKGMLGQQMMTLDSIFKEIRLLAPAEQIRVTPGEVPTIIVERRPQAHPESFRDALQDAMSELVGRLRTLLDAGVPIASDITGGRDSRTVLAALLAANTSREPIGKAVRFRSNRRLADDWAIAKNLSSTYSLNINRAASGGYQVDPAHSFKIWRMHDLGTYSPVYPFSTYAPEIALSGAAGGVHRNVYRASSLTEQVLQMKNGYISRRELDILSNRVIQSMDFIGGHSDRRLEHFRQFRNRFHGGRVPLRTLNVAPLASRKLKVASGLMRDEHLERAQFYADVMLNLSPSLAAEPYDVPAKGWDEVHHKDLTRVDVTPEMYAGKVYGQFDHPPRAAKGKEMPLEPFLEAFHDALPTAKDSGLLPPKFVQESTQAATDTKGVRFPHAVKGIGMANIIMVGQAVKLSGS